MQDKALSIAKKTTVFICVLYHLNPAAETSLKYSWNKLLFEGQLLHGCGLTLVPSL